MAGCSRAPQRAVEQLAIPPFENLSSDTSADWIGREVSGVLGRALQHAAAIRPIEVASRSDVNSARATEMALGYFVLSGSRLEVTANIRDIALQKTVRTIHARGDMSSGVLPVIQALARQISADAQPFATQNETAAKEFFLASAAKNPEEIAAHLELALHADPGFGAAYLVRAETLLAAGQKEQARSLLDQAGAKAGKFSEEDRARLELLQGVAEDNSEKRRRGISQLAKLNPRSVDLWRTLAELDSNAKDWRGAVEAYQTALRIEPRSLGLWNSLGYAQAEAGDLNGALRSFAEYQKLAPNDANPLDSIGDVQFHAGHFADAAQRFIEANTKDKNLIGGAELYRAAVSRLLAADEKGADELWRSYAAQHKDEPLLPLRSAVWTYQKGQTAQAMKQLADYANQPNAPKDLAALARVQMAILYLDAGDGTQAREETNKALAAASAPAVRTLAGLVAFVCQPRASVEEWQARAQKAVAAPQQIRFRKLLVGYALVFGKSYREAIPVWKELADGATIDQLSESRIMLALCYVQSGERDQAIELARRGIFPPRSPDPGLDTIMLPHYMALRRLF